MIVGRFPAAGASAGCCARASRPFPRSPELAATPGFERPLSHQGEDLALGVGCGRRADPRVAGTDELLDERRSTAEPPRTMRSRRLREVGDVGDAALQEVTARSPLANRSSVAPPRRARRGRGWRQQAIPRGSAVAASRLRSYASAASRCRRSRGRPLLRARARGAPGRWPALADDLRSRSARAGSRALRE